MSALILAENVRRQTHAGERLASVPSPTLVYLSICVLHILTGSVVLVVDYTTESWWEVYLGSMLGSCRYQNYKTGYGGDVVRILRVLSLVLFVVSI